MLYICMYVRIYFKLLHISWLTRVITTSPTIIPAILREPVGRKAQLMLKRSSFVSTISLRTAIGEVMTYILTNRRAICWKYIYSYVRISTASKMYKITYACILGITDDLRSLWLQWPSRIRKPGSMAMGNHHSQILSSTQVNVFMFIHPSCWRTAKATAGALVNFAHGKMKRDGIQWHSRRTMSHCDFSPDGDLPIRFLTLTESTAIFVRTNYIAVASVLNMRDGTKGHFCITCSNSERNHETWGLSNPNVLNKHLFRILQA
jgi:hypothetical protein